MKYTSYELHEAYDPSLPLRLHLDKVSKKRIGSKPMHWHEHIELLYVISGNCAVEVSSVIYNLSVGDVILISPDCSHTVSPINDECYYYCITVDLRFCTQFGIPTNIGQFAKIAPDTDSRDYFDKIISLFENKPRCYREQIKALCLAIISSIYSEQESFQTQNNNGDKNVSKAIDYINRNFAEPISVDELCKYVGLSKYYFCRLFKEVTGRTVVDYINLMRCINAKRLIVSGQYNVGESAIMSGFKNLSYFTKTYKILMGNLPSKEKCEKQ